MVAVLVGACGSDDSGGSNNDAAEPSAPAEESAPEGGGGPAETIEVTAKDFEFAPTELSVGAGAEVTVSVTNDGNTDHTFTIEEVVDVTVPAGGSTEGTFTAPETGSLEYVCNFHPSMKGTITIGGSGGAGAGGDTGEMDNPNY